MLRSDIIEGQGRVLKRWEGKMRRVGKDVLGVRGSVGNSAHAQKRPGEPAKRCYGYCRCNA